MLLSEEVALSDHLAEAYASSRSEESLTSSAGIQTLRCGIAYCVDCARTAPTMDMTCALPTRIFAHPPQSRGSVHNFRRPVNACARRTTLLTPHARAAATGAFNAEDFPGHENGTGKAPNDFRQAPEWVKLVVILLTSSVVAFLEWAICRRAFRMPRSNPAPDTI
jgi:hypothetical protein